MKMFTKIAAAALTSAALLAAPSAHAGIIGVAVDPLDNSVVGETEFRADLGGDAIKYYITLDDNAPDCTYGVTALAGGTCGQFSDSGVGGPTVSMYLLFEPINIGADYVLDILFEDLDLDGANDPAGFLESLEILSADGLTSFSGLITDIGGAVTGDAGTQQLLSLFLGTIISDPFLVRLDFTASSSGGTNTPEYLIAEINQVPLPAALPLFLAGLAGMSFASRKKKAA